MSELNNWFGVRFPNIQATIDQTNDQESKLLKLCCKEVWQHQQDIVNDLKTQLNNMESCYIGKKKQVEAVEHVLGCAMIGPKEVFMYAERIQDALRGEHASN